MKKFDGLLKSEIKRVEKFAQKRDGKDSRLTGYGYHETEGTIGFITVKCEICSNDMRDRERRHPFRLRPGPAKIFYLFGHERVKRRVRCNKTYSVLGRLTCFSCYTVSPCFTRVSAPNFILLRLLHFLGALLHPKKGTKPLGFNGFPLLTVTTVTNSIINTQIRRYMYRHIAV